MDVKSSISLAFSIVSAGFLLFLNAIFFVLELAFTKKAEIDAKKQVVVITGCDTGFGKITSEKLAAMNFKVFSTCMTKDGVNRLKGAVANAMICDVTKAEDVEALAAAVQKYTVANDCKLWCVVNNAGIATSGAVDWTSEATFRKVMEVNFFGVLRVTKALLPLLKRNPHSRIVNLSSLAGILSGPLGAAYCASKHALEGMTKALRQEMVPWKIHVTNINPGFMSTPMVLGAGGVAEREFEEAPPEIRDQYGRECLDNNFGMLPMIQEDPQLTVTQIIEAVTNAAPPMWLFPGVQAQLGRSLVLGGSGAADFFGFLGLRHCPTPTKEALKKFQS